MVFDLRTVAVLWIGQKGLPQKPVSALSVELLPKELGDPRELGDRIFSALNNRE